MAQSISHAKMPILVTTWIENYIHICLNLPSAKIAKSGEVQSVFMVPQERLCPLNILQNLAKVVPAGWNDPLFSWQDRQGNVHPMVKATAIMHINLILKTWGWGTTFGHSFRIGGASFYLSQKVDPKIVCIAGHWCSLAYEAYICAFEQVALQYLGGLMSRTSGLVASLSWVGYALQFCHGSFTILWVSG